MKALGLLITKWGILSLFSRGKIARKYEKRTGNEFVQPTVRGRTIRWLAQHLSMSIFSLFCQSVKVWQMCGHFCDRAPSLPAHTPSPHIHIPLFLPLFRRPLWRSGGYQADSIVFSHDIGPHYYVWHVLHLYPFYYRSTRFSGLVWHQNPYSVRRISKYGG